MREDLDCHCKGFVDMSMTAGQLREECEVADPCWRRIFEEVSMHRSCHKYISKFAQRLSVVIVTFMTLGVVVWLFCTYALSRFKAY